MGQEGHFLFLAESPGVKTIFLVELFEQLAAEVDQPCFAIFAELAVGVVDLVADRGGSGRVVGEHRATILASLVTVGQLTLESDGIEDVAQQLVGVAGPQRFHVIVIDEAMVQDIQDLFSGFLHARLPRIHIM